MISEHPTQHGSRNHELDFLRGIAILMTFMAHVDNYLAYPQKLKSIFSLNWGIGVDVFFVLSGFLITRSLLESWSNVDRAKVLKIFWIKRIYRIMPASLLWISLASIAAYLFLPGQDNIGAIAISAAAATANVMNFYYSHCVATNEVVGSCGGMMTLAIWWSLSLEEQFYIVFPILLLVLKPRLAAIFVAFLVMFYALQHKEFFDWWDATRLEGICMGVLLGILHESLKVLDFRQCGRISKILVGLIALPFPLMFANLGKLNPDLARVFDFAAIMACFLLVFLASRKTGFFSFGSTSRSISKLGKMSFSFYLCHSVVLAVMSYIFFHYLAYVPGKMSFGAYFVVSFVGSTLLAWISYRVVEAPFIEKGRGVLDVAARPAEPRCSHSRIRI